VEVAELADQEELVHETILQRVQRQSLYRRQFLMSEVPL
jgi:hypothetical protein